MKDLKEKLSSQYDDFVLAESDADKDRIRSNIKLMVADESNLDPDCHYILGLIDYESQDWRQNIDSSINHFKAATKSDKNDFLARLYVAHCYHDLNQLELALDNYLKVDKVKLKQFQFWRYVKMIEQIGYCYYKLGDKKVGEEYFQIVLDWYRKLPEIDRVAPTELLTCLPENHRIVTEIMQVETS